MTQNQSVTFNISETIRFAANLFASLILITAIGFAIGSFFTYIGTLLP